MDLEKSINKLCDALDFHGVFVYEHGELIGVSIGTKNYLQECNDIRLEMWETSDKPRLRLVREET